MRSYPSSFRIIVLTIGALLLGPHAHAQSLSAIQGRVVDSTGAIVVGANITVHHSATGLERVAKTDGEGNYQFAAVPIGLYRIQVQVTGFQSQVVESQLVEVGRSLVQDFQLVVGDLTQEVTIRPASQAIERGTTSVGHIIDKRMVQ